MTVTVRSAGVVELVGVTLSQPDPESVDTSTVKGVRFPNIEMVCGSGLFSRLPFWQLNSSVLGRTITVGWSRMFNETGNKTGGSDAAGPLIEMLP